MTEREGMREGGREGEITQEENYLKKQSPGEGEEAAGGQVGPCLGEEGMQRGHY